MDLKLYYSQYPKDDARYIIGIHDICWGYDDYYDSHQCRKHMASRYGEEWEKQEFFVSNFLVCLLTFIHSMYLVLQV